MGMGGMFGHGTHRHEEQSRQDARTETGVMREDPEAVLKTRLARGEITTEEYQKTLAILRDA